MLKNMDSDDSKLVVFSFVNSGNSSLSTDKSSDKFIVSDFYKEYKKSEKILIKLLKKSIIKLKKYIPYENLINKNSNNLYYPSSNFIFETNNKLDFLISFEFNRLACLSGYFKYVINTGNDYLINNKEIKEISYFYKINEKCKIWKDFDKECKIYMKDAQIKILSNTQFLDSLNKIEKKYISKNFNIKI